MRPLPALLLALALPACAHGWGRKPKPAPEPKSSEEVAMPLDLLPEPVVTRSGKKIAFEAEGRGEATRYQRMVDAEEAAEKDAYARAMRVVGINISAATSDLQAFSSASGKSREVQVIAEYIQGFALGAVSWERDGPPRCRTGPTGSFECRLRIKGTIVERGNPDPSFEIAADPAAGLGLSHVAYRHEEKVEFSLRASQDAALYVFSVDEQRNAYLIIPNRGFSANRVKAGQVFRYPPKDAGLELFAALPEGKDSSVEFLLVIATKGAPLISVEGLSDKEMGPYKLLSAGKEKEINERLQKLDRDKWTMAVLPYEIRR